MSRIFSGRSGGIRQIVGDAKKGNVRLDDVASIQTREPLITIGVPVYNSERTLGETIESVLSQSYSNFELLISDNASKDKSLEIAKFYQKLDPRITVYEQTQNIGALNNFTFLLQNANSDYFRWLAADDKMSTNSLLEGMSYLKEHPEGIACALPHFFDHEIDSYRKPITFFLEGNQRSRLYSFFKNPGRSHGVFYSLFRRDAVLKFPFLDTDFFAWDWCLILYLLSLGPIGCAHTSFLVSGSHGMSSTNLIYKRYGLVRFKRVLPYFRFTVATLKSSNELSLAGRFFLLHCLFRLNIKHLLFELRIVRYKFSTLRRAAISFLKKFS